MGVGVASGHVKDTMMVLGWGVIVGVGVAHGHVKDTMMVYAGV